MIQTQLPNPMTTPQSQVPTFLSFSATSAQDRTNVITKQPRSNALKRMKLFTVRTRNMPKPANAFRRNSQSKEQVTKRSFLTKTSNLSGSRKFPKAVLTGRAPRITAKKNMREVTAGAFRHRRNSFRSLITADTIPR